MKPATVVMACLFAICIALQYNDPDPLVWMALYMVPLVLSLRALRGGADLWPNLASAAAYSLAALWWAPRFTSGYLDDERAREAGGLLLSGVWMAFLAWRAWRQLSGPAARGRRTGG